MLWRTSLLATAIFSCTVTSAVEALPPPGTLPPSPPPPRGYGVAPTQPPNSNVTISVPVKVSQIPSFFTSVLVQCGYAPTNMGSGPEQNYSAPGTLVNGAFDGVLKVSLGLLYTPSNKVTGYTCDLWLAGGDYLESAKATDGGPAAVHAQPKAGSVFIGHVKGNF